MIRVTLETLVLFLLPFVIYAVWVRISGHISASLDPWSPPLLWLVLSGLVLVALAFLMTGLFAERHIGNYIPAHIENGHFIPGEFQ
jgi:uncharacterized membrane protein YoaK (UPF0700 family)